MKRCSKCRSRKPARGQRYCLKCKAEYMREWRADHPMTPEQRRKDIARSVAGVYKRRGKLIPKPCEVCGASKTEMHHEDYDRPLDVRWLCRPHHVAHHHAGA